MPTSPVIRWTLIALCTLVLSACNTLSRPPEQNMPTVGNRPIPPAMTQARQVAGLPAETREIKRYPVTQVTHASEALPYPAHPAGCACCEEATQHPFARQAGAGQPSQSPAGYAPPQQVQSQQFQPQQVQLTSYGRPYCPPGGGYSSPVPQPHTLPPQAFSGPYPAQQPWAPPGIERPWPEEEYLCDGGDQGVKVRIGEDWSVHGLNQEDTVVHYDTIEGARVVEPTNKVCIYSPRFAAVRKLDGVVVNQNRTRSAGVEAPQPIVEQEQWQLATTAVQPVMPGRAIKSSAPIALEELQPGVSVTRYLAAIDFHNVFSAYEDFSIIQRGILDEAEKARLAQNVDNALVWSLDQAAQVVLDRRQANVVELNQKPQVTVQYNLDGKPRLQVVKVASKRSAQPGELVEFTIRFDNIGTQTIGNVTIIDNLTTRLEYVADSAQCNLDGQFLSQENEGESLVLRYEVTEPMEAGEGGILRFKCRVR